MTEDNERYWADQAEKGRGETKRRVYRCRDRMCGGEDCATCYGESSARDFMSQEERRDERQPPRMTTADTMTPVLPATPETAKDGGCSSPSICSGFRSYYEDALVTIYLGDSREILPALDIEPVVLVTDPPYSSGGFNEAGKSAGSIGTRGSETIALDNLSTRGYQRLMREVLRSCRTVDEAYIFTDWRMWVNTFDALEDGGWRVRNMLVWDKGQMGMGMPWRNQHELVAYAKRTSAKIMDGKRGNVLNVKRSGNKMHPTEKPLDLCLALLDNSQPGLVLDPFAGSGTTLCAAKLLGRKAIGIEMDERHAETAANRCSQGVMELGSQNNGHKTL